MTPYNYVISPNIRKSVGLNVNNSVIVFDEGHNLENTSEDVCSHELSI